MATELVRHRFTVDEYHKMADAGIFTEDDRVELIDGEIVEMPPIGDRHAAYVDRLNLLLITRIPRDVQVRVQNPLRLNEFSEPQPDIALLRARPDFYASGHPGPDDTFLVVEVADTTVEFDREIKAPLYARNNIPEFWLLDLNRSTLHVFRGPEPAGYGTVLELREGDSVAPLAFPGVQFNVAELLGLS